MLIPALVVIKVALPGTLGAIKQSFLPAGGLVAEQESSRRERERPPRGPRPSTRCLDAEPLFGQGYAMPFSIRAPAREQHLRDQWLVTLLETGMSASPAGCGSSSAPYDVRPEAKRTIRTAVGCWSSIAARMAAFAVGMFTYDAFSFIQVTFLLFILVGSAPRCSRERPTPLALRTARQPN